MWEVYFWLYTFGSTVQHVQLYIYTSEKHSKGLDAAGSICLNTPYSGQYLYVQYIAQMIDNLCCLLWQIGPRLVWSTQRVAFLPLTTVYRACIYFGWKRKQPDRFYILISASGNFASKRTFLCVLQLIPATAPSCVYTARGTFRMFKVPLLHARFLSQEQVSVLY